MYLIYLRCVSERVHRGALSDGARNNFDKKGMVVVSGHSISTERALELAIEAGAEDVKETEDEEEQRLLQVSCEEASWPALCTQGFTVLQVTFIPSL